MNQDIQIALKKIYLPAANSHKGQNGRLLIIGGSKLFHAASLWALQVASRIVDLVHYASVPEDNRLVAKLKQEFRNGIVIPRSEIESYIEEDDCILIGPGMERGAETKKIVDALLAKYPDKKWVVDGGALQEVNPTLLKESMIITPNVKELALINSRLSTIYHLPSTILSKGPIDTITPSTINIVGGSPGMTKGGTGDVLSGLLSALATKNDLLTAAQTAVYVNGLAGDHLKKRFHHYYSASELIEEARMILGGK